VLRQLLSEHPDLESDATRIATELVSDVSPDDVASDLRTSLVVLGYDQLNARSGPSPYGYTHPTDAAWEMLEETVRPEIDEMKRRLRLGFAAAAESICVGIVRGLREAEQEGGDVLAEAPDFPNEMAQQTLEALLKAIPEAERSAVRGRVLATLEEQVPDWELGAD
jgi:GT2 family glycosyltransferase